MKKGTAKRPKLDLSTLKRLFSYILGPYKARLLVVFICILFSALASVAGSLFLRILIDSYITPLVSKTGPVSFAPLLGALAVMLLIYASGVIATYLSNRLMITIAQGTLKTIRDAMFSHMQSLPIRYFDTRSHGDLMSLYTNDADTLRQMVTQSIPNFLSSIVTVIAIFLAMLATSWQLTIVVLVSLTAMLSISSRVARKSGSYFVAQQKTLGKTNGYIEEMINGQKVIKVFTHEQKAKQQFDVLNEELAGDAFNAHRFANILMPIMGNISYIQYVVVAIVGGFFALSGIGALTLGAIASFLQLSRTINMPINQMASQLNSVAMALAGTKRIFALLDEQKEIDEGTATLVNVTEAMEETEQRTERWAWKDKEPASSPLLRGMLPCTRSTSGMWWISWCSRTSPSKHSLGRKLPLLEPPGLARQPSPISSTASMTWLTERSAMMASTSTGFGRTIYGVRLGWFCRMCISSVQQYWKISATAVSMPLTRRYSKLPGSQMLTPSSPTCRRDTRPISAVMGPLSPRASVSSSPLPVPWLQILRFSSSMRQPAASTHTPRKWSRKGWPP